ncbi:MAG: hypothetical protein ACM3N1_00160 [Accumulibacter sp.]
MWELFDEAVRYEEDPSGVHAGLVAIKTKKELEYRAYEICKNHIEGMTRGPLKLYRDKAITVIQTLFLYHIGKLKLQGLSSEDISNEVLLARSEDASPEENIQHYEIITDNLKKELRQIIETRDEDKKARYKFDPVFTGIDPRAEFQKARDEAESNPLMRKEAWEHLLSLDRWEVKTRQMTLDLSSGIQSIFVDVAQFSNKSSGFFNSPQDTQIELLWNGKQVFGIVGMRDLNDVAAKNSFLPSIDTDATDNDFAVYISTIPVDDKSIQKILAMQQRDPRIILWSPAPLTTEERDRLLDFAAYRKLVADWTGKDSEDAILVINWVSNSLQAELAKIKVIVDNSYSRGSIDSSTNMKMNFRVAGSLETIIQPVVNQILDSVYVSASIKFDPPILFKKEEAVKVINGIVRTGNIPKGAKPNQFISAAKNFGAGLKIVKRNNENQLDTSENEFILDMWEFIDKNLRDDTQRMKVETIYKNFIGIGGPKNYGLSKKIVQIYLLCLVRECKIRLHLSAKAGISPLHLDYSNISDTEFNVKALEGLLELQKMAAPQNWEVLRPFAEKLLNETIPLSNDEALISPYREKINDLFKVEKEESERLGVKLRSLFEFIQIENIFEAEVQQFITFFNVDLSTVSDIDIVLFKLKEAFNYNAFDTLEVDSREVDDFSQRITKYNNSKKVLKYETEIRVLFRYISFAFPEDSSFKTIRETQKRLKNKTKDFSTYLLSEIKLKTDIIGNIPAPPQEKDTLGALIRDYTLLYLIQHDKISQESERVLSAINSLLEGDQFKAFKLIEDITVFQPPISGNIISRLKEIAAQIFSCTDSSRHSVEEELKASPQHKCGFDIKDTQNKILLISEQLTLAEKFFNEEINKKIEILLNPSVKSKLEQGKDNPLIAKILSFNEVLSLKEYLFTEVLSNSSLVAIINKYLQKIQIKKIHLSDFKPSGNIIEIDQIDDFVKEFRLYIEREFQSIKLDNNETPVLHIE